MKLHDLIKLLGDLLYIIAAVALGHILVTKVLMHSGGVDIGAIIAVIAGLVATKLLAHHK